MRRAKFIALGALIVFGAGALFFFSQSPASVTEDDEGTLTVVTIEPEHRESPPGMHEYRSARYRFSLFYPESMTVTEQDEGTGASTISFEDAQNGTGFQIFVVPFLDEQISEERFRMDIPSGVRRDVQNITVDGATGASFFSESARLGETAEVWFVQDGYLYEVATVQPLASWLSTIMESWEFIDA